MPARKWLIKSEPEAYSWDDLVKDGETIWDGVRNHRAANNLRAMGKGEQAFFYHSVSDKAIVGIVEVSQPGLADPKNDMWAAVRIRPLRALARPVTLAEVKADAALADVELVRQSRLSVAEMRPAEWKHILSLAKS